MGVVCCFRLRSRKAGDNLLGVDIAQLTMTILELLQQVPAGFSEPQS